MIYHHKFSLQTIGGGGDGSVENPWYWYEKTSGYTVALNNESSTDNKGRLYIRVKLLAGTTYYIGETPPGGKDGMIWLYDAEGNTLTSNDDDYAEIAGIQCSDHIEYTPGTTGIYIIGAGAYGESRGGYTLAISELPEADPPPASETRYLTSSGFTSYGRPVKYSSASLAGAKVALIPKGGLIFYASLSSNQAAAQTGQTLQYNQGRTFSFTTQNGIPCCYVDTGSSFAIQATISQLPSGDAPVTVSCWIKLEDTWDNVNADTPWQYGNESSGNLRQVDVGKSYDYDDGYSYCYFAGYYQASMVAYPNPTSWHHLCAVYTGDTVITYLDGVQVYRGSLSVNTTKTKFSMLDNRYSSWYAAAYRIYNRVLSDTQIQQLANQFTPSA